MTNHLWRSGQNMAVEVSITFGHVGLFSSTQGPLTLYLGV